MTATLIDGKAIAEQLRANVKAEVERLKKKHKKVPGLAAVLVGDNPASSIYVKKKREACAEVGIYSELHQLPKSTSEKQLLKLVAKLNKNKKIHGILMQLPLPDQINEQKVLLAVSPEKDIDGFNPLNLGMLFVGQPSYLPCTPKGILKLIKSTGIQLEGKNAVVVGRSNIVGKPVSILLLQENCTVTVCHSRTKNLAEVCRQADVLVVAVGKAGLITKDMIKPGAVVIDVGINRIDGKIKGDVADGAEEVAGFITPVPGGVGPMTVACLLENTLEAAKKARGVK